MKIALQRIKVNEPYSFSETVDVSELEQMDNDIRHIGEVNVNGDANVDKDLYHFRIRIKGTMVLPCARTLVDVPYPFEVEVYEQFTTASYKASEEEEIHFVDREVLDLMPYIKENILLEVPLRVFSNDTQIEDVVPEQEGFTVLEEDTYLEQEAIQHEKFEEESKEKVDPRLSSLKDYFNNNE
ncbi:YceD family protein [Halalkalibacillus halophilus]|uniref:YceD family protein n=1 Tax=Halalkalibacillus halophilus TaxID=392827 RepID=UPI000426AA31|nr:YceD family protein [Halalkalibacillus halophilus]